MNVLAGRRQLLALGPLYIEHPPPSQEASRWGSLHGFSEGCEPSQEGSSSSLLFSPFTRDRVYFPQFFGVTSFCL